jgi:hypothetical protein
MAVQSLGTSIPCTGDANLQKSIALESRLAHLEARLLPPLNAVARRTLTAGKILVRNCTRSGFRDERLKLSVRRIRADTPQS